MSVLGLEIVLLLKLSAGDYSKQLLLDTTSIL